MSLYSEASELTAEARAGGVTQAIVTTEVDPASFEALADAIEAAYPNMAINRDAIEKGGVRPDGSNVVPFAAKQRFPIRASVTFYYNGKVVWAGIEPIEL